MIDEIDKKPLVSIIIPVFNVQDYLDDCVSSAVNQTWERIEILLIDDGSSDSSGTICDNWQKKDSRVRVIHRENSGVSSSRNWGIHNSLGSYILFLDADDYLAPQAVEKLYLSIESTDSSLSIGSNTCFFEGTDIEYFNRLPETKTMSGEEFSQGMYSWQNQYAWGKLFSRDAIIPEAGEEVLFREDLCFSEDIEWLARVLVQTKMISCVSEPLYYYRIGRSGSATTEIRRTYNERYITSVLAAYEAAISTYKKAHMKPPIEFFYRRISFSAEGERTLKQDGRKTGRYFGTAFRETLRGLSRASGKQQLKEVLHYAKQYVKARTGKK